MIKPSKQSLELLVIFLIGLAPLLWFKPGFMAAGHDMSYPLAPIDFWLDRLFIWTDRIGSFGSIQTDAIPGFFIHGLQALFYYLTNSLPISQKLVFIFWFTLPGLTMYALLKSLHPKDEDYIVRISGSLFYMLNHYLLQGWVIAEMSKFSIVAAIPLVVLAIINVNLKAGSVLRNSILVGITLFFLNGGAGIPLWGGLAITAIAVFATSFFISKSQLLEKLKRGTLFCFLSLGFVLLLNLYWLYPYVSTYQNSYTQRLEEAGGNEGSLAWSKEISKNSSFTNLFKLQGIPDWYDNANHPYANTFFTNYFLIILTILFPLLGFFSLLTKKNPNKSNFKYVVIFLSVVMIAVPFTAGSHPPTGILYDLALKYLPVFPIFRTPFYKFGMALWFAYSYLIAVGLSQISSYIKSKFSYPKVMPLLQGLFIIFLSIYNFPAFTGVFFDWSNTYSTRVKIPNYIFKAKEELEKNHFSSRTLMLPRLNDANRYISYDWKYFSLSTIPSMLTRKPVLINDVALSQNEPALVNSIYEQLEKYQESNLLKYVSADKVLIQNDYEQINNLNYSTSLSIESGSKLKNSTVTTFGKWDLFNIDAKDSLPLFYIPNTFSYFISETSKLSLVSHIPTVSSLGEALVVDHVSNNNQLSYVEREENTQSVLIQAQCQNCEEKKTVNVGRSSPPLVPPSNPFYFIIELIDLQKSKKYILPTQQIDFILGTTSKEISAMDSIVANPKNEKVVTYLLTKWENNVNKISSLYNTLENNSEIDEYSKRISAYYWELQRSALKWQENQVNNTTKESLNNFEDLISKSIQQLDYEQDSDLENQDFRRKVYYVNTPTSDSYRLAIYNYKPDDLESIIGQINSENYSFQRYSQSDRWYLSEPIVFDKSNQVISFAPQPSTQKTYPGFQITSPAGKQTCKSVELGMVDENIIYKIDYKYSAFSSKLVGTELIEKKVNSTEEMTRPVYPATTSNQANPFLYNVSIKYQPSVYADSANLKICLDGSYDYSSILDLEPVNVTEEYPDHLVFLTKEYQTPPVETYAKVRFVALNQTAYLVNLSGLSKEFILGFNARFDNRWKIREVDQKLAEKYFKGESKSYLEGRVVEFARQDNHVLTNFLFKRSKEVGPDTTINAFANAWRLNPGEREVTYLVEFTLQRTLYTTTMVSIITLITLSLLLIINNKK